MPTVQCDDVCNMNDASAKRSTWIVRIDHTKIVEYSFISRGETVLAQKMICTLIGKEGTDYGQGIISYCFKNKKRALQGMKNPKFLEGRVLRRRPPRRWNRGKQHKRRLVPEAGSSSSEPNISVSSTT